MFVEIYGFSLGKEGLAFLGILIGVFVAIPPFFWYMYKYVEPKFNDKGELKPEYRLPPAFFGGLCIPICLFWFGWRSVSCPSQSEGELLMFIAHDPTSTGSFQLSEQHGSA